MPVAVTAERADARSVPCTSTVVGTPAARLPSWSARKLCTGASAPAAGAAWAGEGSRAAARTARPPAPRRRRDRFMALLGGVVFVSERGRAGAGFPPLSFGGGGRTRRPAPPGR